MLITTGSQNNPLLDIHRDSAHQLLYSSADDQISRMIQGQLICTAGHAFKVWALGCTFSTLLECGPHQAHAEPKGLSAIGLKARLCF